jgi:hypothetical protein
MRILAMLSGIGGGLLAVISAGVALLAGGADTVVIGGWITACAGLIAAVGGAAAVARPRLGALLMAVAAVTAGLVCPGVIPAIADSTIVFVGLYLPSAAFIVAGAVLAWISRDKVTRPLPATTSP